MQNKNINEKLHNAVLYFIENTENLTIEKLTKLLLILDFNIYKHTGKTVTGGNYSSSDIMAYSFSENHFTRRELKCMSDISKWHDDRLGEAIRDILLQATSNNSEKFNFDNALTDEELFIIKEKQKSHQEMLNNCYK